MKREESVFTLVHTSKTRILAESARAADLALLIANSLFMVKWRTGTAQRESWKEWGLGGIGWSDH